MTKINFTTILFIILIALPTMMFGQALGYNNNRIAYSSDGNSANDVTPENQFPRADPDDWCGSPMSLAIIAKKNLQNKLVHFSYNNFMASPPETDAQNQMKKGVSQAITNFGYNPTRFFDVSSSSANKAAAINHLKLELEKSTATDPLYFILAGPSEFFYQCVQGVVNDGKVSSLDHVYIISHSGYNENEKRRYSHHTLAQTKTLANNLMHYQKIVDQNTGLKRTTYDPYFWLRDHQDTKIRFVFERMKAHPGNVADPSDAGMTFYLLTNDQNGTPEKLKTYFGNGIFLANEEFTLISSSLSLFPNPTKDLITIKGLTAGDNIIMTNVLGKTVLNIIAKQEDELISTAGLNNGLYMISITGKTKFKLVKE
jgi:Secretion system C-terminal sorting domain